MDSFVPEEITRLRNDGLDFFVETKMTVESYLEIRKMQEEVKEEIKVIGCPQLFILGGGDKHIDVNETKSLIEKLDGVP